MELIERYLAVARGVAESVEFVSAAELGSLTPCDPWTVRDVLNHMGHSARTLVAIMRGEAVGSPGGVGDDTIGDDPVAGWEATTAWMVDTFTDPEVLSLEFHHPAGAMTGADVLVILTWDHLVHTWDLAQATGRWVSTLDGPLVDHAWELVQVGTIEIVEGQRGRVFGDRGVDEGNNLQRLLRYTGRDPSMAR